MGRRRTERRRRETSPIPRTVNKARLLVLAVGAVAGVAAALWGFWPAAAVARDGSPAWSPDGSRIAFYSERDGNAEIYVMDADGGNVRRLTTVASDEGYPSWSPDGRTITFDSDRDGNFEIYAMNADGTNVRRLTNHPSRDVSATWAPDGSGIAFMSDRDGGFDVYLMNSDGSNTRRATKTGTSWFPVWSQDSTRLAFHVGRDVHTMPAAGGDLRRLTHDPDNGMYPSWSPDGSRLVFMSWRSGRTQLYVMNADGTAQKTLVTMERGDAIDPRWSPDGLSIAFVHMPEGMNGEERAIYVVNADGSGLRKVSR
jgi:Tol biopolymer transport system component